MSLFYWAVFVVLSVSAIFIASGISLGPVFLFSLILAIIFAFRYTYAAFYIAIFLIPFLGLTLSIPTGELAIGKRAFGGSIDISVAEAALMIVLAVWALKIVFFWLRRGDSNWKPVLPLVKSYLALFLSHVLSAFSPLNPDRLLVLKYSLRPVLFSYLAFIALPVNLLRSRRRLLSALSIMASVGTIAALNGAVSLFFVGPNSQYIRRAHPLPMFGIPALGDNHNLLAELLAVTVFVTLALSFLVKKSQTKQLLFGSALLQGLIGILTFSRTVWIVFAAQTLFLAFIEYRHILRRHAAVIAMCLLLLIPVAGIMLRIGVSSVAQSSTSTRWALTEIAAQVFASSPIIGSGAGTFVERVGSAYVFRVEYGEPLDSHGLIQKLAAETGLLGLLAFAWVVWEFAKFVTTRLRKITDGPARHALLMLTTGAGGAMIYQLFNTNYWTGKMWFPVGITLAAFLIYEKD